MKSIDLKKLKNKENIIISSGNSLSDIEPMQWSEEVLTGKKKVEIKNKSKAI